MSLDTTISLLTSGALLSLYPILVRSINVDLLTHTLTRLITATIVCYPFTSLLIGDVVSHPINHIVSIVYVIHIWSSYLGFRNLDVGIALTLFYTYPMINVLIKNVLDKKNISRTIIYYFLISFMGVVLISHTHASTNQNILLGIIFMLLASITESIIYIFQKNGADKNPFNMLFGMCFTGSIILLIIWLFRKCECPSSKVSDPKTLFKLFVANMMLGVIGYLLRFYGISRVTTEWFSILSFMGIIFGYIYGWIFYRETITVPKLIGTLLILYSVYNVKLLGY